MTTKKQTLISRLLTWAGLGKSYAGGSGVSASCWACSHGKCGLGLDRTCSCCRSGHGA